MSELDLGFYVAPTRRTYHIYHRKQAKLSETQTSGEKKILNGQKQVVEESCQIAQGV